MKRRGKNKVAKIILKSGYVDLSYILPEPMINSPTSTRCLDVRSPHRIDGTKVHVPVGMQELGIATSPMIMRYSRYGVSANPWGHSGCDHSLDTRAPRARLENSGFPIKGRVMPALVHHRHAFNFILLRIGPITGILCAQQASQYVVQLTWKCLAMGH